MAKDEDGIENIAEDYRQEKEDPLAGIPSIANAPKKKPSVLNKAQEKISELKQRYSSYQSMQKERAKEKAMKELSSAREERQIRLLEKQTAQEKHMNFELKEQAKELNKKSGSSNPLMALGQGIRSFSSSRKAFKGNNSSGSGLLSGGLGGGSGLLSQGLGNKSSLLSGGMGGKNKMLMGGLGKKKNMLSGGLGKSGMSLSLGKGKGLKL